MAENGKNKTTLLTILVIVLPLLFGGGGSLGVYKLLEYRVTETEKKVKENEKLIDESKIDVINFKINYIVEKMQKFERSDENQTEKLNQISLAIDRLSRNSNATASRFN